MYRAREPAPRPRPRGTSVRPVRRANHPVIALQQTVGNHAVGQILARKSNAPTIQIGKFTIEVAGGNIDVWAANEVPETLVVTSQKGKHSAELAKLFKDKTRIKLLTLTVPAANKSSGQQLDLGSLAIEIKNGRITDYSVDGKTESWQVADFDGVHRTRITRKVS